MNQKALEETVLESLNTGKIGTPVAMRIFLQITDQDLFPDKARDWCESLAEKVFQSKIKSRKERSHKTEKQASTITLFENGTVLSSTVGCIPSSGSQLQFLLIGQEGIIQSEGIENISFS